MGPCGINEVTCHVSGYDEGGLLTYDWKVRSHLIFVFNLRILTVIFGTNLWRFTLLSQTS